MVSNLSWDYYCTPSPTICPLSLLPHLLSVCSKPYCFHSNLLSLLALYSWQKKGGYQVTLLSASCYQSCELACICSHFSFPSVFVQEMFLFLNQIVVSTSTVDPMLFCLLRVFLDYSFFFLYLLPPSFHCLPLFFCLHLNVAPS